MSCDICKEEKKTYSTFGKQLCKKCIEDRKTGIKGHSGMVYKKDVNRRGILFPKKFSLLPVKKSNPLFVKWFIEHYPKSKGIVGRQLNYLIYRYHNPIGIIGFASPPINYIPLKENFGDDYAKKVLNNNVFRIVETGKNFGTQILSLARKRIKQDYRIRYRDSLTGLITFVERPRTGAMYKADNWTYIGETIGVEVKRRGENWMEKQYIKTDNKKLIFIYKYRS